MERPGFSCCICPDAGLIKAHVAALLEKHPAGGPGAAWERHTFWGDEELPPRFWEHLTLQGLFGTPRVLLLRQAQNIPAAAWKRISAALGTPNAQSWCIFCLEVGWEKGQPKVPAHILKLRCMAFAEQKGWIWRSPGLDERGLKKYALERAKTLGLTFEQGALEALCATVPPDAAAVDTELAKLALAAGETRQITPDMASGGGYTPEHNIFAFIRCVQAGNVPAAWRELHRGQRESDGLLFPFLGLLMREARTLWQVQAGEAVRLHPNDASAKKECAARLGFSGLARLFTLIVQAEWHVKSGERSPEQALEALVADLILLFRPKTLSEADN